jgi:hypothetical protein
MGPGVLILTFVAFTATKIEAQIDAVAGLAKVTPTNPDPL